MTRDFFSRVFSRVSNDPSLSFASVRNDQADGVGWGGPGGGGGGGKDDYMFIFYPTEGVASIFSFIYIEISLPAF